jgi:hypothetical protein
MYDDEFLKQVWSYLPFPTRDKIDVGLDLPRKGFEIADHYAGLPLQERMNIIARAFDCKTASVQTELGTGKWRGTSSICLTLDNGSSLCIGMYRTPVAKKPAAISAAVNNTLAWYNPEILKEIKARATAALRLKESIDNAIAEQKGLKPYKFLCVEICDGTNPQLDGHLGWYYVTIAVGGKIIGVIETGMNYDITNGKVSAQSNRPRYFVAGGLEDEDVDFVFNGVGHASAKGKCKIGLTKAARERAEIALSGVARINQKIS